MHSHFTFNANAHRASPNYRQQSGFPQTIFNFGVQPVMSFMTHPQNLVNHGTFTRSFASVVSCENSLEKRQNMLHINKGNINQSNNNNSGIIGSLLRHFNKPSLPQYQYPAQHSDPHKEFEDFKHMPSLSATSLPRHNKPEYFHQQPTNHINMKMPSPSSDSQNQNKTSANNNNCSSMTKKGFMASLFGGGSQEQQQKSKPSNQRWFRNSFRYRGGSWRSQCNKTGSKFHDYGVNLPKNTTEKERSYIEQDIKDDSCDFVHVIEDDHVIHDSETTIKDPNETAKVSYANDPPFMICSLEDFPAINGKCSKPTDDNKIPAKKPETKRCDQGFVVVPNDATVSTPTFTPKRISLCDKIIKSPQKLFPTCTPIALKPCLKAPRRRVSECSDDFIVFADDCGDYEENDIMFSDTDSETDSEEDDDDDVYEDDDEMSEIAEEEDGELSETGEDNVDGSGEVPEHQVDSGVEEKMVRFNMTPKVHVMRAWDFAYRACRKGDYWQQVARDHERFQKRISQHQQTLTPILDNSHREKIFRERFQDH